jgi:biotin carboxyl carrier protein
LTLEVRIGGKKRTVEIAHRNGAGSSDRSGTTFILDGKPIEADIVEVARGIYSVLLAGQSFEVRVDNRPTGLRVNVAGHEFAAEVIDPRQWRRQRGSALETEGRQQVIAPMPGKIVRVLVAAGEIIEAKQGLMVVEAMKMQNEIRSPKRGTVERLMVVEGLTVNAGEVLAIIA